VVRSKPARILISAEDELKFLEKVIIHHNCFYFIQPLKSFCRFRREKEREN